MVSGLRARRRVQVGFVLSLMAALVGSSCSGAHVHGGARSSQLGERESDGEQAPGEGPQGRDKATEDSDVQSEKAVVFIDRGQSPGTVSEDEATTRAEPTRAPIDATGGSGSASQPAPSNGTRHKDSGGKELPPSAEEAKPKKEKPKTTKSVAHTEVESGDTRDVQAVSEFFMAAHGLQEAENWSTEFAAIAHTIGPVYTHPGSLPTFGVTRIGSRDAREWVRENAGREVSLDLPLEHTHVDAEITGPIARVFLQQTFTNPFDEVIEAVYTFPLPENSAVDGMKMVIGERVIEGVIMEREQARQAYESAKATGYTAALLEQERPNVFTQSVANIAPKVKIDIETRYLQDLSYDSGKYEFVFPMVVGPRYMPPGGASAARLSPPVLGRGERSGHDVSMTVRADAGVAIRNWEVPTHEVDGNLDASGKLTLRLASKDRLPNRDFVLRYAVAGAEPQATVLSELLDGAGYFTLMVQPPEADINAVVGTREMVFVVDVSGSMAGVPLAMGKEMMEVALSKLRPVDTFNIITFASGTSQLFDTARPANRQNLELAMSFVDRMESGGGSRMLEGLRAALDAPLDAGMNRVLVFLTDGYIGNEEQVLESIGSAVAESARNRSTVRAFAFGVGSSTNRYLIDGIAEHGEGVAEYALTREDPQLAVDSFFSVIDRPIWTDVELDFGSLTVDESTLYPTHIPALFASHPLVVHGRYSKAGKGTVTLRARANGGKKIEVPIEIELTSKSKHKGALGTLWARAAIGALQRDMLYSSEYTRLKQTITSLGIEHGLVTPFTSFLAVDRSETVKGGGSDARTIEQRVESPEGVGSE